MSFFPEKGRESYLYRLSYLFPVAIFGERSPGDLGILFFILNVEKYSYSFASFLHKLFYNSRKHAVKVAIRIKVRFLLFAFFPLSLHSTVCCTPLGS